jgi:hypothetical protein
MIRVRSWSSIALVSILTLNSGAALSKGIENTPISDVSVQTEPVKMANIFRTIQRINQTANQERLREERRQQAEEWKRQREIARKEALEKRRLEAERRRQYFESLSPEQQQAYIEKQQAEQARRVEAAASLFTIMRSLSNSSSNQQDDGRTCRGIMGKRYDTPGCQDYWKRVGD